MALFLSVGEREYQYKVYLKRFHKQLLGRNYAGLEMTHVELEGETHVSQGAGALTKGLKAVFSE